MVGRGGLVAGEMVRQILAVRLQVGSETGLGVFIGDREGQSAVLQPDFGSGREDCGFPAHQGDEVGGGGRKGGIAEQRRISRDQPAAELRLGALFCCRRPAFPSSHPALPAIGESAVGQVGRGIDTLVRAQFPLQLADREHERQAGVGPCLGLRRALRGAAQGDGRKPQKTDDNQGQQHHQREGHDKRETVSPGIEGG